MVLFSCYVFYGKFQNGGVAGALGHLFLEVFLAGEIFPAELSEHIVVFRGLSDLLEAAEADHALDMVPPVARLFLWLSENCETRFVTSS